MSKQEFEKDVFVGKLNDVINQLVELSVYAEFGGWDALSDYISNAYGKAIDVVGFSIDDIMDEVREVEKERSRNDN